MEIRKSKAEDLEKILTIFDSARRFMRSKGNYSQWGDDYPGKSHIVEDILNGNSYVGVDEEGEPVMTFAFIPGKDPTYEIIREGEWLNDEFYGTIHRIASNGKQRGVLKSACDFCFQFVENIRIDTHEDNFPMLKALRENEFIKCGIIKCRDGSPRIAFQKQNKTY